MCPHTTEVSARIDEGAECEDTHTTCNKDTGGKRWLQKWTRGVWFCVGGGGHRYVCFCNCLETDPNMVPLYNNIIMIQNIDDNIVILKKEYTVLLIQLDRNLASDVSTRCVGS